MPWIALDVPHANRQAGGRSGADNSFCKWNAPVFHHFGFVADREAEIELIRSFFRQQYSKNFVVDQSLDFARPRWRALRRDSAKR